jgi:hypothetical protein
VDEWICIRPPSPVLHRAFRPLLWSAAAKRQG